LLCEAGRGILEQHAILRALGSGDAGLHGGEVELKGLRVNGFGGGGGVEETLLLVIGLDEGDLLFAAAGETEVAQRFGIDGEDAAGAPYSGAMLLMVARSASGSSAIPGP